MTDEVAAGVVVTPGAATVVGAPPPRSPALLTVGHGTADAGQLTGLLRSAGVELLVDIRRFPASRAHPHLAREALSEWLPEGGVAYRWEERLGGRRRLDKTGESPDSWWTVEAFRAYAAYTRSSQFSAALDDLLGDLSRCAVAVMCSESVWWRCHRRLVADVAVVARGREVLHLMPDGKRVAHRPARGAGLARTACWCGTAPGEHPHLSQAPATTARGEQPAGR